MKLSKCCFTASLVGFALILFHCSKEDDIPIPECTNTLFPVNGQAVPSGEHITLRWLTSTNATKYDVFLAEGGNEPVLVGANLQATEYEVEVSSASNTTYSWFVSPKNDYAQQAECSAKVSTFLTKELPAVETSQIIVNVLVLCFDPIVNGTSKLHEVFQWADPKTLAQGYIEDVRNASHDLLQYNVVEWREINDFPEKVGGFKYDYQSYSACMANHATCRTPDDLDYKKMFVDYDVLTGINDDVYDEVWVFGAPYFGFWESAMAGNGAFYINGGVFPDVNSKAFAIMGFSYERGVAEMLHNLCHRTESTMSFRYGGWQAENLNTSWARFAANQKQSGVAAVGSCHYPPNANSDYDYCNEQVVQSSADDWYNYPYLTGAMKPVNVHTWGLGDCQREYLKWWFHHLPYRSGQAPDGFLNNWWKYIYELN